MISVAITFGIIVALIEPVIDFFGEVPFGEFFAFDGRRSPSSRSSIATLMVTFIALLVAVPLGLGAAMYLSEYASPRARKIPQADRRAAGGRPSVVYGFFALTFVTPTLLQDILDIGVGFTNALAAGLVLGVMIIPTIASLSEDSFSAVPQAHAPGLARHGRQPDADQPPRRLPGRHLRGRRRRRARHVPGVGETMIVALAAGAQKNFSLDPTEGMQTMTGFMAQTAGGESPVGSTVVQHLFAVGMRCSHHAGDQHDQHRLVRRYRQAY